MKGYLCRDRNAYKIGVFFTLLLLLSMCRGVYSDAPIDETKSMLRNLLPAHEFLSASAAESVLSSGIILLPHVKQRLEAIAGTFDPDCEVDSLPWGPQTDTKFEAFAVTVGTDSKPGQLHWCVDSGASCHFSTIRWRSFP